MKLENKAKAYKVLAAGLKYGGIFLCCVTQVQHYNHLYTLLQHVLSIVLFHQKQTLQMLE